MIHESENASGEAAPGLYSGECLLCCRSFVQSVVYMPSSALVTAAESSFFFLPTYRDMHFQ